jgi:pimeloyl-ACP methyl ester carboxylesterase
MKNLTLLIALFASLSLHAQSNVRGWYADGQVWIVWKIEVPLPRTVGIYASPSSFSSTDQATLIGRPYELDYLPTAMKEQIDTLATYKIPTDTGTYTLALNEGLFVFTPHQPGALYFAVVPWGETNVTKDDQITDGPVGFDYDPIGDPVECHRQAVFPSPFTAGYLCAAYYMWADGRDDHRDGRPDFPVMANAPKNGMPGFFMISVPAGLDTTQPFPLTVWLHGGEGNSRQSLAGSRGEIDIHPESGMLLSHNDDMFGFRDTLPAKPANPTWHFGWRLQYDPFSNDNLPSDTDTVINYTQRRYLWIDQWLIRHFNIDPARIHINGHSMGSAGATALAKAYPSHYASVSIFNNGFGGPEEDALTAALFGSPAQNFPTNFINRNGEVVRTRELFDIIYNISPERDLPVFRSWHGKNDDNGTMRWDAYVIENYHTADSLGHGMHLYWSERPHGVDMSPDFDDHWIMGIPADMQTATDNVSWEEDHFRSDISYPAFYNHRLDPNGRDPGDGTIGTGANGDGDDWGTWGGYHRWDNASLTDQPERWAVDAWLEADAVFDNDNCPYDALTADLAIRKPVLFKPASGDMLSWKVEDLSTQQLLQEGNASTGDDDLVSIPGIVLYPASNRKVRITIETQGVSTKEAGLAGKLSMMVHPNPSQGECNIHVMGKVQEEGLIRVMDAKGQIIYQQDAELQEGKNIFEINSDDTWPAGLYVILLTTRTNADFTKWIKN